MKKRNSIVPAAVPAAGRWMTALMASALMALCAPLARADEAGSALTQYDKPVDEAIDKALAFLAHDQSPNGTFPAGTSYGAAVPALCVMAFLSKGHVPGQGPYGETINKSIDAVLALQQENGFFPAQMYSHGIATLMLSEVSGMVDPNRQKRIDKAFPLAMKLILAAQKCTKPEPMRGGWRYTPSSGDSDISCTGWQLMGLRSARNNGTEVPKESLDDAVKFILNCHMPDGGFAYQPGGGSGLARTGTALLCLELSGRHREKVTIDAGEYILKNMPKQFGGQGHFYYALYYCSQGMFQLGGDYWDRWASQMYDMMLKFQKPDGSWPSSGDVPVVSYSTAMSVLAISVAYRQLPIYQR